jgi:hypothetical protein
MVINFNGHGHNRERRLPLLCRSSMIRLSCAKAHCTIAAAHLCVAKDARSYSQIALQLFVFTKIFLRVLNENLIQGAP